MKTQFDNRTTVHSIGAFRISLETVVLQGVTHVELAEAFTQLLRGAGYTFDGELQLFTEETDDVY